MVIKYTIIIPHYNTPDLLVRCLKSIPEREDIQVVIVDDNSPGSDLYLSKYKELKRAGVEFYINKDGLGAGHIRNIALQYAKGKWLMFADADDFFVKDLGGILDENYNEQSDVIYYNMRRCDSDDVSRVVPGDFDALFDKYDISQDRRLFSICHPMPWGKIIRRKLVEDNNIRFQETRANNDFLFSVKVGTLANSIKAKNQQLYWYTYRLGSLSNENTLESLEKEKDRMRAFFAVQEFLDMHHIIINGYVPFLLINKHLLRHPKRYFELLKFMWSEKIPTFPLINQTFKWGITKIKDPHYNYDLCVLVDTTSTSNNDNNGQQ